MENSNKNGKEFASFSTSSSEYFESYLRDIGLQSIPGQTDYIEWAPENKQHPRQWPSSRKVFNTVFILLYEAFEAAVSSVGASAAIGARKELGMSNTVAYLAFTTVFVVGEGIAGLVFPPLSESFGRKRQYILSSILFCCFCGLSAVPSAPVIIIARLLAGFVGGIPPCIGPGSLEDIYTSRTRTWCIFGWATSSNIGLVLGPIVSSYIADRLGWQWIFYIASAISFGVFSVSLFFFESRPTLLLARKVEKIKKETGVTMIKIHTDEHKPTVKALVRDILTRPTRLLFTEPIIIISSFLNGLAFALIYALTEAFPIVYTSFGFRLADTALPFLAVLVGVVLSIFLRLPAHCRVTQNKREQSEGVPEQKLVSLLISAPTLCAGLSIFAWTIPPLVTNVHFIVSMIALVPIGIAANDFDAVIAEYIVDVYGSYAASAFASVTWMRALLSVAFTLSTDRMFRGLGANVASSICAACAVVVSAGAVGLWKWGAICRKRSAFASERRLQLTDSFTAED